MLLHFQCTSKIQNPICRSQGLNILSEPAEDYWIVPVKTEKYGQCNCKIVMQDTGYAGLQKLAREQEIGALQDKRANLEVFMRVGNIGQEKASVCVCVFFSGSHGNSNIMILILQKVPTFLFEPQLALRILSLPLKDAT